MIDGRARPPALRRGYGEAGLARLDIRNAKVSMRILALAKA